MSMADYWIPHMPDYCPVCGQCLPVPIGADSDGIPAVEHRCLECGITFLVLVRSSLETNPNAADS